MQKLISKIFARVDGNLKAGVKLGLPTKFVLQFKPDKELPERVNLKRGK